MDLAAGPSVGFRTTRILCSKVNTKSRRTKAAVNSAGSHRRVVAWITSTGSFTGKSGRVSLGVGVGCV